MKTIFVALWLFVCTLCNAQTVPGVSKTMFQTAGLSSAISFSATADITTFGGLGNGAKDNTQAFINATTSLGSAGGYVYFPPGNFLFLSAIDVPDNIVLKGASSTQSTLTFSLSNAKVNCITMKGSVSSTYRAVTGGFTKDSRHFTVSDVSGLSAGQYLDLRQANGSWDSKPTTWGDYSVGQILIIDSIKVNEVYFHEKLRIDYSASLNPEVSKITPAKNCGVECLKITRTDNGSSSGVNYGIFMSNAVNCHVSGVDSYKSVGAHIMISSSKKCSVTGCYFHEAYEYDGENTHGYGVALNNHTSEVLVANNIFRKLRHSMVVKEGANGNVFVNNCALEPTRSEYPTNYGADICLHGHYSFYNLFEGNIVSNIQIDQTWGPTGPYNTFLHNRATLYGITMTSSNSHYQNFIANDVTGTGFLMGQFSLSGSGIYSYGNRDNGTVTPSGTSNVTLTSLYYNGNPPYWSINYSCPSVGLPSGNTSGSNAALDRYNAGNYTVCGNGIARLSNELSADIKFNLRATSGDMINIYNSGDLTNCNLMMFDVNGKMIMNKNLNIYPGENLIETGKIASGLYSVVLFNDHQKVTMKILLGLD